MPLPECKRIDIDDEAGRQKLLAEGWREIEVLETWLGPAPRGIGILTKEPWSDDVPALQEIARLAFGEDRLHRDPMVASADADAAKAKWVIDAFRDYRRKLVICGVPPMAFLSYFPGEKVIIDLLAVHPDRQGENIASRLIVTACHDAKFVQAGTQATNEPAKRLYDSLGMMVIKRERTFHR